MFLTLSCRRTMGVRCLIVVVHRSHRASASPIHPTRSSHLPLISRSPKHNKCRSNHSSKDSLLLGKCVSLGHVHLTEWNPGLIYICVLTGSTDCSSYWMEPWAYLHLCADWQYWLFILLNGTLGLFTSVRWLAVLIVHLTEWNTGIIYICVLTGSIDCYRLCKLAWVS